MSNPVDLDEYANQFDELKVEERTPVIDFHAINPLSELRESWENATNTQTEHQLSTSANTDDTAFLETDERGQYTSGYQVQAGTGIRLPALPTGDSEARWGYYEVDDNGDPLNGYYFGADSTGIFTAKARDGVIEKVYREEWNRDSLSEEYPRNPSGLELDLADGQVFQIEFVYYGYGSIEMQLLMDNTSTEEDSNSEVVTVHVFQPDGETSIENTNLPLREEIDSGGTSNDALDLFVGGRQFSILGKETTNDRRTWHYLDTLAGVDDTQWYAAMSFKAKDGTDIGSIDFTHVLGTLIGMEVLPDTSTYKWQIRRGTVPDSPTWESPESAEDKQSETAFKVDTASADVLDGSGDLTGVHVDGGIIQGSGFFTSGLENEGAAGTIVNDQVITLLFKAAPTESGTLGNIFLKIGEKW